VHEEWREQERLVLTIDRRMRRRQGRRGRGMPGQARKSDRESALRLEISIYIRLRLRRRGIHIIDLHIIDV